MTERKMTGHTQGGGGLQNHSIGSNYPGISVILEVGDVRWYGVMEASTGSTLYVQSREEQERLFALWKYQWSVGKRMADHGVTGHRYRVDGKAGVGSGGEWFDGLPPLPPPAPRWVVVERTVYEVCYDGVTKYRRYSTRSLADGVAEEINGSR